MKTQCLNVSVQNSVFEIFSIWKIDEKAMKWSFAADSDYSDYIWDGKKKDSYLT